MTEMSKFWSSVSKQSAPGEDNVLKEKRMELNKWFKQNDFKIDIKHASSNTIFLASTLLLQKLFRSKSLRVDSFETLKRKLDMQGYQGKLLKHHFQNVNS